MNIDDVELPDIIDIGEPDTIIDDDDEDEGQINKMMKKIEKYAKEHKVATKRFKKYKRSKIIELQRLSKELMMMLYAEAHKKRKTYAGFINKQDELRRAILKSLLRGLSADGKVIVVRDLLYDLEDDPKPTEYYIR
jgi:hypothetical protein